MNAKYETYLKAKQRSQNTIRAYTKDIQSCLDYINKPDNEITLDDLVDWQKSISNKSSATVARTIASVKSYFKVLAEKKEIPFNPAEELASVAISNKEKTPLTLEQVFAMANAANTIRSKAIIMMLVNTGLRISELINLTIDDYHNDAIDIFGKGNKHRKVYLSDETREVVDQYIKTRNSDYPNLFISNGGHPMQSNNISIMLKNTAKKAGIENWKEISNHWFRTTAATLQSENGVPVETIQKMLGHERIETTMIYVKASQKRVKEAMTRPLFAGLKG